jgi:general secretion pathway protein C
MLRLAAVSALLASGIVPPGPQAQAPAIEAVGLVRSPTPARSVAILRAEGKTRVVAVGETAFGARLLAVGAETVQLEVGGKPVELRLAQAAPFSVPAPPRTAALPSDAPPEDPATPPRDMEKRQVQIRLGEEMNRILSDTALAPVTEDGRVVGLQIKRIAEGSLLTDAGLRAGDVLTSVNGTTIDGMASLIALWPRLQSASELNAVVLRGGQPFSLRVTLR